MIWVRRKRSCALFLHRSWSPEQEHATFLWLKPCFSTLLESRRNELRLYWNAYLCELELQHGRDVACNVSPNASAADYRRQKNWFITADGDSRPRSRTRLLISCAVHKVNL